MMYGFDLEGTLDADPEMFRDLCSALITAGRDVVIITAYYCPADQERDPQQEQLRYSQIDAIGFVHGVHYKGVAFAKGPTAEAQGAVKRDICKVFDVALMFEDRQVFTDLISEQTRCVLLQPRR